MSNNGTGDIFGVDALGNMTINGVSVGNVNMNSVGNIGSHTHSLGAYSGAGGAGSSGTINIAACNCGCQGVSSMHTILSSGILGTLSVSGPALTPDESKELEQLKKDRDVESKRLKLVQFKELPAALRQQVVDNIIYQKFVRDANATQAPATARETELETKKSLHTNPFTSYIQSSGLSYTISSGSTATWYMTSLPLPTGITEEELIKAHNDACAEEALTGTESK